MDFTTRPLLPLPNESSADGVNASTVVTRYDLTGTLLPPSSEKAHGLLPSRNVAYASRDMDRVPKALPTSEHPRDAVQASLAYPGTVKTAHSLLFPGDAVHASRGENLSLRTSTPELLKGAIAPPSDKNPAPVSTAFVSYSTDITTGSACESPDSAAVLRRTIVRLRATINTLTASSSALFPTILPALSAADAMLDVAASHDLEASPPKQRRELRGALMQLSDQLGCFALAISAFSPVTIPSQVVGQIPEFHGFENNADDWVATVNAIAVREAWTEPQKWSVAVDRLRNGAAAWHRYEGVRQQCWTDWSCKLIAAFGRIPYDTNESTIAFTEDGAEEDGIIGTVTAHCSLTESFPSSPRTNTGLTQCCGTAPVSGTRTLLREAVTAFPPREFVTLALIPSFLRDLDEPTPLVPDTPPLQNADEFVKITNVYSDSSGLHLRLQVQLLAACADDRLELTEQEDLAREHQENKQPQMVKPDVLKEQDLQHFMEDLQRNDGMEVGVPIQLM